jgi:ectoine hydroxylase-related dioxygenase (phytanoyl-CoA dioxygenase family)
MDVPELTTGSAAPSYRVSVDEYISFRKNGFLVVSGLLSSQEVDEFRQHTEDLMQGRLREQTRQMGERELGADAGVTVQGLEAPPAHLSPEEKAQYFLRIHMLHHKLELHERYLLHPRVLDVLEVIIGPDVLALQSMLFLKPPGKPGQGWHQDSYYIPTHPDTLCGAWAAIDDVDELNGALWVAKGSNVEPVYPPRDGYGFGDTRIHDIGSVTGISDPIDDNNDLTRIASKYDQILVSVKAGDVVFFGGHILHRSKKNFTTDRMRRSFVGHYCNARSFTQWGDDPDVPGSRQNPLYETTGIANGSHILARGDTHLPFAQPLFGTPCAALISPEERRNQSKAASALMADMDSGMMDVRPADPAVDHDHGDNV